MLSCCMSMFPTVMMTVFLVEREILVKLLFYENKGNASAAFRELHRMKNLY